MRLLGVLGGVVVVESGLFCFSPLSILFKRGRMSWSGTLLNAVDCSWVGECGGGVSMDCSEHLRSGFGWEAEAGGGL